MIFVESKEAYPYITRFKKEPFKSFVLLPKQKIGSFYFSQYTKVTEFYKFFLRNLKEDKSLNLETLYWFLLFSKYLREDIDSDDNEFYNFIKLCEVKFDDKLGFNSAPTSVQEKPDIWSTYYALASLHLLGRLEEYLQSKGKHLVQNEIKEFIISHDTGDEFSHCLAKNCKIDDLNVSIKTLYYVIESLRLLGIEVRTEKYNFLEYIGDVKKESSIIFKLLCLKYLGLESGLDDKAIRFLHQFEKEDGGFSFNKSKGTINTTFWVGYNFHLYQWLHDYNPAGLYSYINNKMSEILDNKALWNKLRLIKISKLIILLSFIWKKFIGEIERVIFKKIEKQGYIDIGQLRRTFGLVDSIQEVISYINLSYSFNLKILDNNVEFRHYIRNLDSRETELATTIYDDLKENSIISLSDLIKKYNAKYRDNPIKIKDIRELIEEMMEKKFFKGTIKKKKKYLIITKYYFYLDFFLDKIIISDTEINTERLYEEKEKLKDIRNDIYNMTLKLKNTSEQIKSEIESYLLIDELDIAKERLKFILRNSLMEADFLNENIENSFNEDLYYVNLQANLGSEIQRWNKLYSILSNRLNELDSYLKEKIAEKEELRQYNQILDELDRKLLNIEDHINKKLDSFRTFLKDTLAEGYDDDKFNLIVEQFKKIPETMEKYDATIYKISQKIKTKEEKLNKKHKNLIEKWVSVKEELDSIFDYYFEGFQFFEANMNRTYTIESDINEEIFAIQESARKEIKQNNFQKAFDIIKEESDILLENKLDEIKKLEKVVDKEIKDKQKLFFLFRYLQDRLDDLEEKALDIVAQQVQELKDRVIKERNRTKIEDFDSFVSTQIESLKETLNDFKERLSHEKELIKLSIPDIEKGFDKLYEEYEDIHKKYNKKQDKYRKLIEDFDKKTKLTSMQWDKFGEFLIQELEILKEEYVNNLINKKLKIFAQEEKTNKLDIKELSKDLDIKCKVLIPKIRNMIEISKLNGELFEDEKTIVVYTDHYYKNKELRTYVENNLLKKSNENVGKLLALFESCIKNNNLGVNILELQNRLEDLKALEEELRTKYEHKLKELQIDEKSREEYKRTRKNFEAVLKKNSRVIEDVKENIDLFSELQNFINDEYNSLSLFLEQQVKHLFKEIEEADSYFKINEKIEKKKEKFNSEIEETQEVVEDKFESVFKKHQDISFKGEIREYFVEKKNIMLKQYSEDLKKINDQLKILKNETYRGKLSEYINKKKIHLSQLLGTLERRVEDYVDIKEFKKANIVIQKRARNIEDKIKPIKKKIKSMVKDFSKEAKDFQTKCKYILDDFNKFIVEFLEILNEKVKSLERLILKSYVKMTISAVANGYLTIGFLNNELKIRKENIQNHLIFLISANKLPGKYDPRLGIYYEDPELVQNLNEEELEVIKKMNFKLYMFLTRLKNFTSQYSSIIAFFASIFTISYYIFLFSGGNPAVVAIPITVFIAILYYTLFKKRREEKVNL
ncbi:MAG: conserved membrane protein of unknown function [Promethearchaeota archaeon]|nr:MAG: conserved membrane protein of unknown function [Candidatus Lokiarchaeota archaeon]